ncbi:MAG: TonB-dependent receptor [Bryobacterales bacterium]|nr:TonB-dependent receptor [Bryobacterales bacterium]
MISIRVLLFCAACLGLLADVKVYDGQGRELSTARVETISATEVRVSAPGYAPVTVAKDAAAVTLAHVTVTATPGLAEEIMTRPEMVLVGDKPSTSTVAHMLEAQPSVALQQTGAGQVSPFLRGLTGYQVLNLVDGVRFNNSTFRSGPNQYLAYLEPSQAAHVEAMLGPSGTQYGSDGLGGTIQILTASPHYGAPAWRGDVALDGQTADLSAGGAAALSRGNEKVWFQLGAAARRHNNVRAGHGFDSHNVLARLYGFSGEQVRDQLGGRLLDTAYSQAGAHGKLALRPSEKQSLTAWYQRGEVHGLRNTKDLWGGLGRLQSTLSPQILDLFYTRYERLRVAGFDSLSGRFSVNRQQDGGTRQGLRVTDSVTREFNRVQSLGYTGQALTHLQNHTALSLGGELYDEGIRSFRQVNAAAARALYPDNSRYRIGGLYAQGSTEYRRLRAGYGFRYSRVSYSNPANAAFHTPFSAQSFQDWTWQGSALYKLTPTLALHGLAGRGFRAPNLNDLGAIGLQDLGYEVPAREAANALLSDSSGEGALSKGIALQGLKMERLRNLEAGLRWQTNTHRARLQFFDAELQDPIVRRTLLFPVNAVPGAVAGLSVSPIPQTAAQRAQGVVTVASAIDPRALKSFVNDGRARYWGVEANWEARLSSRWFWANSYSFLLGRDLDPNRNIRRLPPQQGATRLRYHTARLWVETQLAASGAQDRLSGGDRDDERIGASRRRQDIADFYNSARGAQVRTGETLLQIQNRVMPGLADATRVTLFNSTPGWASIDVRAGVPLTESLSVEAALTNIADRNYRIHGSGIDSPGRSAHLRLRWRF